MRNQLTTKNKDQQIIFNHIQRKRAESEFKAAIRRFKNADGPDDWCTDYFFALCDVELAQTVLEKFGFSTEEIKALVDAA